MTPIIGIDPGPLKSGVAIISAMAVNAPHIDDALVMDNEDLVHMIRNHPRVNSVLAIEDVTSYGRAIGKETIETAVAIGRLIESARYLGIPVFRYDRRTYGLWITGGETATDKAIRGALEATFGGYKKGEPLFALRSGSHVRSAFAVAKYHEHRSGAVAKSVASCGELPGQTSFLEVER